MHACLDHLLQALEHLGGVNESSVKTEAKRTMSRISGLELLIIVYSNGLKKSFWNLKCGSSSFSRKRMASCRRASRAKKPT